MRRKTGIIAMETEYIEMHMNTGGGANLIMGKKELEISCWEEK